MDKETLKKFKEAQRLGDEALAKQKLEANADNKEFWAKNLEILKQNRQNILNRLAETDFLIKAYEDKINSF